MSNRRRWIVFGKVLACAILFFFGIFPWLVSLIPAGSRSYLSRIRADLRSVSTALESYYVDNNEYPAMRPLSDFVGSATRELNEVGGKALFSIEPGVGALYGLTTPVPHLTSFFNEPLINQSHGWAAQWPIAPIRYALFGGRPGAFWPYPYYNDRNQGWIIWASGPDRIYDIANPSEIYDATVPQPSARLNDLTYDPTNGTYSRGDIWRAFDPRIRADVIESN